jgi:uncharacterized protein (UPF0371 family)
MPALTIIPDLERDGFDAMNRLRAGGDGAVIVADRVSVGALRRGMESGKASVALCLELPDGNVVFAETSLALLVTAARTLAALYGEDSDE